MSYSSSVNSPYTHTPLPNTPASSHHYSKNSCHIIKLVAAAIFAVMALALFCAAITMPMVQLFIPAIVFAVIAIGLGADSGRGIRLHASVGTPQATTYSSNTYVSGGYPASPYRAPSEARVVFTGARTQVPPFSGPGYSVGSGTATRTTLHGASMTAVPVSVSPGAPARDFSPVPSAPSIPEGYPPSGASPTRHGGAMNVYPATLSPGPSARGGSTVTEPGIVRRRAD